MRQCFLFNEKLNFQDFYMKIGMYVHFCHTKRYSQKKLKNLPKLQSLENGLNFQYARKNPSFYKWHVLPVVGSFWTKKGNNIWKIYFFSIFGPNILKNAFFGLSFYQEKSNYWDLFIIIFYSGSFWCLLMISKIRLRNFENWIFPGHLVKVIFFNYLLKSENFPNFVKYIFIHKNYTCM